ncbi:magnesium transporter [Candidatus Woesearchaeota archaeon]|nr:MAG: magnesium transporter [Candidatus Woesearchaeota archaeon]
MKAKTINSWVENLANNPNKRIEIFKQIPNNQQSTVILKLSRRLKKSILDKLKDEEVVKIIDYLDPDEATDILQLFKNRKRKKLLKKLKHDLREKVEFLLKFNPNTAAGLMNLDYIQIDKDATFEELARIIKKHEKRTGKIPAILAVADGLLIGEVPTYNLALASKKEKIEKYIKRVPHIKYSENQDQVVDVFKKHPHNKIVVLDDDESIMGIIYSDDIIRIIEKKSLNSLADFAGVSKEEDVLDNALVKVKNRYKWLILNLATAFLAASVVGIFEDTISGLVLLAAYMPVVAGMGGNAGTQTLAVMVRGIALKEINMENARKILFNEISAGIINGFITGLIVAIVASLWNKNPLLGLLTGVALVANLAIAGFFGTIVPLIMKRLGKDPATSATIFITTATDVCGFFVFLGLASLIL